MLASPLAAGVLRRARERGVVEVFLHQLRDYASDKHLQVDDAPYGGGPGMVMRPEPLVAAIEHVAAAERPRRILLSPRGVPFNDERAPAIARWRREESLRTTLARRPDLLARAPLGDEDRAFLRRLGWRDG